MLNKCPQFKKGCFDCRKGKPQNPAQSKFVNSFDISSRLNPLLWDQIAVFSDFTAITYINWDYSVTLDGAKDQHTQTLSHT